LDQIDHLRIGLFRPIALLKDQINRPKVGLGQSGFGVPMDFSSVNVSAMKASRKLQHSSRTSD
jgi:hypothetical protein